jgi:hypothetical protein
MYSPTVDVCIFADPSRATPLRPAQIKLPSMLRRMFGLTLTDASMEVRSALMGFMASGI